MPEESNTKTVGSRRPAQSTRENIQAIQRLPLICAAIVHSFQRGVYRFNSYEEADAWQMRMLARSNLAYREKDAEDRMFLQRKITEMGS